MCFHMPEERHAMPHWDLASVVDLLKHVPQLWVQGGSWHNRKLRRGLAGKIMVLLTAFIQADMDSSSITGRVESR